MFIFIEALSARDGGGVTYINNLLSLLPKEKDIKIYILVPKKFETLKLDKRVTILKGFNCLNNPILRFFWLIFFLKRILRKLKINIFFVPGGISYFSPPKNCKLIIQFRNMLP